MTAGMDKAPESLGGHAGEADDRQAPLLYPAVLKLEGRRCLVVGGGEVALRKTADLLHCGAIVHVVAPDWRADFAPLAARSRLSRTTRAFADGDLDGVVLVVAATDDPPTQEAVASAAARRGVLCNVVDVPALCSYYVPATARRGSLMVSVSTEGKFPLLAVALRDKIAALLGPQLGAALDRLAAVRRRVRTLYPDDPVRRKRLLARLVEPDALDAILEGRLHGARGTESPRNASHAARTVRSQAGSAAPRPGRRGVVSLVGAGPGDAGLLTLKAAERLREADVVYHDALIAPGILALCRRGAKLVPVGKRRGAASAAQDEIEAALVRDARAGMAVVRLKGGDPFVFGRGGEEALALARAGVEFEVVPGVSSGVAAPASAGIPLTHRGLSSSAAFVTAHDLAPGERGDAVRSRLAHLARGADTLVLFMAGAELARARAALVGAGLSAETPAARIESGTLPEQRVTIGALGQLETLAAGAGAGEGPVLVVVGKTVGLAHELGACCAPRPAVRPADAVLSSDAVLSADATLSENTDAVLSGDAVLLEAPPPPRRTRKPAETRRDRRGVESAPHSDSRPGALRPRVSPSGLKTPRQAAARVARRRSSGRAIGPPRPGEAGEGRSSTLVRVPGILGAVLRSCTPGAALRSGRCTGLETSWSFAIFEVGRSRHESW